MHFVMVEITPTNKGRKPIGRKDKISSYIDEKRKLFGSGREIDAKHVT
jgi:hypothetical protein